jgi:hypothetical protein
VRLQLVLARGYLVLVERGPPQDHMHPGPATSYLTGTPWSEAPTAWLDTDVAAVSSVN